MPSRSPRQTGAARAFPPSLSRVLMTSIVLPGDTNARGTIFGGRVLEMIDKAGAIAALRHCRAEVVTASMDHVDFRSPIRLGDIVRLEAVVNQVFRSSLEVGVKVYSEDPRSGERRHTTTADVTLVAVDAAGRPQPAPPLELRTPRERRRAREAERRRRWRLEALRRARG
jgi:acyl-CoA hydrolase